MREKRTNSRKSTFKFIFKACTDPLRHINVTPEREEVISKAIGTWAFSAHEFTDDELLYGASVMLQHALTVPELEQWRMPAG